MKSLLSISYLIGSIWTVTILLIGVQGRANYNLLPKDCGQTVHDGISSENVTLVYQYPWMAIIRYIEKENIVDRCAGSLINDRYVLTAAHCIKSKRPHSVVLGEHTKSQHLDCNNYYGSNEALLVKDCADPVEEFGIESFEYHQDYNRPKYSNDIGLLRLNRSVIMKDQIQPICLPVTSELQSMTVNEYIVTGWGTTEDETASDALLKAVLPGVSNEACQKIYERYRLIILLGSKQICAGGENRVDSCRGDSGGPLGFIANHEEGTRFVQFGIASVRTRSCGQSSIPGVYSRVASYMDWILDKMSTDQTSFVKVLYRKIKNKG